eukprot:gene17890-21890_t
MNRTVNALETAGLVSKETSDTDARKVTIELTAAGRAIVDETKRHRDAWFSARLARLTPHERQILHEAALVSNTGAWMQRTAQDWIVLTELTNHDAAAVGITMALQFGPLLFLMPLAGVMADRFNRRLLLMWTQGAQGILGLALGALVLFGAAQLWHVYVF